MNINLDPPIIVEDACGAGGACRDNDEEADEWVLATVPKTETARGQTTINQKVVAKMFKILL